MLKTPRPMTRLPFSTTSSDLGQDRAADGLVLGESAIEGDDLEVGRLRERGQISVIPDLRRKRPQLGKATPQWFDPFRLLGKDDARIGKQLVVHGPGVRQV